MNLSLPLVVGASGFGLPETQTCSTKNQSPAILSSSEYALYKFGRNNTVVGIILWRGQACFSVSVHHVFSHFVCHVPIYLGINCLAKKEYKFPIVKQLVGMWQQCDLLQFVCRAIGVECGIFPVWWNNEPGIQTVTDILTWIFTDLMSYCRTVVNIHVCESLKEHFFASLSNQWLGKVMK